MKKTGIIMRTFALLVLTMPALAQTDEIKNSASEKQIMPVPGEFHKMLARSNGKWKGEGTMQFSADASPIPAGNSTLVNKMVMDGLYHVSEIKGNPGAGENPGPEYELQATMRKENYLQGQ